MKTRPAARLTLCLLLALACPLAARTLYLSQSGDDSAAPAPGAAFRTLAAAVKNLAPGDTLVVRNGVYRGGVTVTLKATAGAPVLIQGESLEAVIAGSGDEPPDGIRLEGCSYVALDRLTVREANRAGVAVRHSDHIRITRGRFADNRMWGIFTSFADDIHFEGNECCGSKVQHGIYHSNSGDRFVIRGNLVHDNNGNGIHMNGDPEIPGGDGVLNWGLVERNVIFRNGKAGGGGINMTHVHDVLVRNNLLYRNLAGGITVYQDTGTPEQGSKRVLITGNTVYYAPGQGRSGVNVQTTSEKVLIAGNTFVSGGARGALQVESGRLPSIISDCNVLWGVGQDSLVERKEGVMSLEAWRKLSGNDLRSVYADPRFADLAADNYAPGPGSPALGAGMPLAGIKSGLARLGGCEWLLGQLDSLPAEDLRGNPRPTVRAPDSGAFQTSR
jgi:hypothetical protein